jgi:hypothetical protein
MRGGGNGKSDGERKIFHGLSRRLTLFPPKRAHGVFLQGNLCTSVASEGRLRVACAQEPEFTGSK